MSGWMGWDPSKPPWWHTGKEGSMAGPKPPPPKKQIPQAPPDPELPENDEWLRVEEWRRKRLMGAGCDEEAATLLAARRDLDYMDAMKLLEGGCPPHMVLTILL